MPQPAYDPNNVFAKILRGELPSHKLYEDEAAIAIMDVMPTADGHTLVIPKEAKPTLDQLSDEAGAAFPALKELATRYGRVRLAERAVLDYLLRAALEEAAAAELPLQFHVAFGDDDADLRAANPLQLRALLTDPAFRRVPFVLLHCYPYVREAGYLAALYAHVYIDVSLAVPLTAHGCTAAFSEALELAPYSKLLFATDAHSIPELFYVGALHGRRGLAQALERLIADDILSATQAERVNTSARQADRATTVARDVGANRTAGTWYDARNDRMVVNVTTAAAAPGMPSIEDNPNAQKGKPGSDHAAVVVTFDF